jgi:hypothetical protein
MSWRSSLAVLIGLREARQHVLAQLQVALIGLLEALVHLREAFAHQLKLALQRLLDAHHALAQLDLIHSRRPAEALLDEPIGHVGLDEVDVFLRQRHGGGLGWPVA